MPETRKEPFTPARIRDLSWQQHVVFLFCVLVNIYLGVQLFAPLFDNDAADADDHLWLADTARRDTLGEIFDPSLQTGNEALDGCYLPIQGLVYHASANLIGPRLVPARVMGVWLHIFISLLVLVLVFRFSRSLPAAHLASLLFLLHPRMVGTISWLCAAVAHGLVWLLYLAAFLVLQTFLHRRTWWRLALGVVLMVVAVLTKELATTLFAVVLLYDVIVVMGVRSLWPLRLRVLLGLAARHGAQFLVVLGTVAMQLYKYDTGFVKSKFGGTDFGLRFPIRAIELLTLFFQWGTFWTPELTLWAMGGTVTALLAGFYLTRKQPVLLFLLLWIPVSLTPYSFLNFRPASVLGRYTYEAGTIVIALFVILLARFLKRWPAWIWPVVCGSALLLALFSYRTLESLG